MFRFLVEDPDRCRRAHSAHWAFASTGSPASRLRARVLASEPKRPGRWLAVPGEGPSLEFEQLVKIDLADSGTKQDILANLAATLDWVQRENAESLVAGRNYLTERETFPSEPH
jgi:hypothetical protein